MMASFAADQRALSESAIAAVERIATEVWDLNELGLHEIQSSAVHVRELETAGFTITDRAVSGVPTAFVAEWHNGADSPGVGFLSEYDALPGLGNAAVPKQEPRADGQTNGHGCGHNLLGAGLTGAAIATKERMLARGISGVVKVFGCAAEETEGMKVYMARDKLFDGLDACLHWHPAPLAIVASARTAATDQMRIEFHGQTSHAGNDPWNGRSALNALELLAHALNQMRGHVRPTARIQYVFEAGGQAPNVVPHYARMYLVCREVDRATLETTTEWVEDAAHGVARATQTNAIFHRFHGMHDLLPNIPLAVRMHQHLAEVGTPAWTADEQQFARACQGEIGVPDTGLASSVLPVPDEPGLGGATDVGDVSYSVPTMGITMVTLPIGISLHQWPVTACGGMSIGRRGAVAAAEVLARSAVDILTDGDLRSEARADFDRRRGGARYVSPLPEDQQRPSGVPEWLTDDGSAEIPVGIAP
jgi:aminobenzoyl-glutamate utilization protein B